MATPNMPILEASALSIGLLTKPETASLISEAIDHPNKVKTINVSDYLANACR